ncbi:MAG: hypothetical protein IPO72_18920 [Saprospiraceae bacterium]|nr:hypothetical protein [Candidatus Vicinibacter affinis]
MKNLFVILNVCFLLQCTSDIEYDCCTDFGDNPICLIADKLEAFADGTTDIILTACIPKKSDDGILNVTFEVPAGLGSFVSEGGTTTLTKNLNGNKTATARLTIGTLAGPYKAKVSVTFQEKTYVDYVDIVLKKNDVKVLDVVYDLDITKLTGDNFTIIKSDISINNFNYAGKSVKVNISGPIAFLTSDLKEMSIPLDVLGKASVKFKTTDSDGLVNIKYNLEIYTVDTTFYIQKSYPDEMKLVANKQLVEIKDTVALDVFFNKKTPGSVSKEISIQLSAFQLQNGNKVKYGNFIPPFLFTTGNAINTANAKSIYLTPVDSLWNSELPLFISASVIDQGKIYAQDTIQFKIK